MLRFILVACALTAALPCAAQSEPDLTPRFKVPRPGRTLDETFIVQLPTQIEMPCVAVDAGTARIVVSRKILDALAQARPLGADWKGEAERMAMIRGDRARTLLGAASAVGGIECAERVQEAALRGATYLVMELLISANAMVVEAKGSRITERLRVEYHAKGGVGGFISFYLDRGTIFFLVESWVS